MSRSTLEEELASNTPILTFSFNNILNKAVLITESTATQFDLNTNKKDWKMNYNQYLSNHVIKGKVTINHALLEPLKMFDGWALIINKTYLLILVNENCVSLPFDLESKITNFKFLNRSNEIFGLKNDMKQYKVWLIDCYEIHSHVSKTEKIRVENWRRAEARDYTWLLSFFWALFFQIITFQMIFCFIFSIFG